jgi:hypothetical protein
MTHDSAMNLTGGNVGDSHLSIVLCILRRTARLYFARLASSVPRASVSKPARPTAPDVRPIG